MHSSRRQVEGDRNSPWEWHWSDTSWPSGHVENLDDFSPVSCTFSGGQALGHLEQVGHVESQVANHTPRWPNQMDLGHLKNNEQYHIDTHTPSTLPNGGNTRARARDGQNCIDPGDPKCVMLAHPLTTCHNLCQNVAMDPSTLRTLIRALPKLRGLGLQSCSVEGERVEFVFEPAGPLQSSRAPAKQDCGQLTLLPRMQDTTHTTLSTQSEELTDTEYTSTAQGESPGSEPDDIELAHL